jgi:hypothetical protein
VGAASRPGDGKMSCTFWLSAIFDEMNTGRNLDQIS